LISLGTLDECVCKNTENSDSLYNYTINPVDGKCWINCDYAGEGAYAVSANICGCDAKKYFVNAYNETGGLYC